MQVGGVRTKVSAPGQEVLKERRREASGLGRAPAWETPEPPASHFPGCALPALPGEAAVPLFGGETS